MILTLLERNAVLTFCREVDDDKRGSSDPNKKQIGHKKDRKQKFSFVHVHQARLLLHRLFRVHCEEIASDYRYLDANQKPGNAL